MYATTTFLLILVMGLAPSFSTFELGRAQTGFGNASIQGTYAAYSPAEVRTSINGSILSLAEFDGQGNWASSILRNTEASDRERGLESLASFGSYSLNSNGMGSAISLTQAVDGTISEAGFDFVVTQVEERGGVRLVTAFYALPRLSSTGKPSGVIFKRLIDQASFDNGSLQGTYALTYFVGANESAGLGMLTFDGDGALNGQLLANTASPPSSPSSLQNFSCVFPCLIGEGEEEERHINESLVGGTFSVEPDGSGTLTIQLVSSGEPVSETIFDLLILQAQSAGADSLATEFIALQQGPEGDSGGLLTFILTRVSD